MQFYLLSVLGIFFILWVLYVLLETSTLVSDIEKYIKMCLFRAQWTQSW